MIGALSAVLGSQGERVSQTQVLNQRKRNMIEKLVRREGRVYERDEA